MSFRLFLEKYINAHCAMCEHCGGLLIPRRMSTNPNHIYRIGMECTCSCGKSRLWTNSIRNEDRLLEYLLGKVERYTNGFCNDKFCGYCYGYVYPLKNGVKAIRGGHRNADRYGCPKCSQNQNIAIDGSLEDGEGETVDIMRWYRDHLTELEGLV